MSKALKKDELWKLKGWKSPNGTWLQRLIEKRENALRKFLNRETYTLEFDITCSHCNKQIQMSLPYDSSSNVVPKHLQKLYEDNINLHHHLVRINEEYLELHKKLESA